MNRSSVFLLFAISLLLFSCQNQPNRRFINTVTGEKELRGDEIWLSHEHILVDFIGADSIDPSRWEADDVINTMLPNLKMLGQFKVKYFVDATPNFLGRDVEILAELSKRTDLQIITNTGLYGAVGNKYIPAYAYDLSPNELAAQWINEYKNGIDGTDIKPGFIKISVDDTVVLHSMHQKLVEAAALTHLETGLTIASHTGEAVGLWPQLEILKEKKVSPEAFIWVHAQNENDFNNYLVAANTGCWISLDGMGWETEMHIEKLKYAKKQGILDRILIAHDAGWYDPAKETQEPQPYTPIFKEVLPRLKQEGFTDQDIDQLLIKNPTKAYSITVRRDE
ncbi:MAG TPA: phosphotriesterase [Cyclobacteriaceae bacterium]